MSHFERTSSIAFRKTATSCVGEPSSCRTWRWRTAAPASHASKALCAISSGVTGRAGCDARVVSAPVTAQVMMTFSLMDASGRAHGVAPRRGPKGAARAAGPQT